MTTVDRSSVASEWTAGPTGSSSTTARTASALPTEHATVPEAIDPKQLEIRLALRVVVHLAQVGPLEFTARPESTQQGIAESLRVTQGAVSKVLRRLSAADVVQHERHHVWTRKRRMQAYSLTPRGLELARRCKERLPEPESLA